MAPKSETVDRLLLSRSLIGPLRFKPANDRFAVAAHVLAAHDAAELAIAAICTELSVPGITDMRALGLPDYMVKLKEHLHPTRDVSARDYVNKLNRVRVDLKHHGITPDKDQWATVAEKIFGHISTWCQRYLTLDYAELDAADLIRAESIRNLIHLSRSCMRQGHFRDCLEHLAEAISKASVELFPIGVHVNVGDADADTALALSGYGVDPARFIVLQRLLPTYTNLWLLGIDDAPQWKKTRYGHKANWTKRNAEFAYEETINLLTRLQEANPYPTPYLYDDVFRNVLVVKRNSPDVTVMRWSLDGWYNPQDYRPPMFAVGERIECRARGTNGVVLDPADCDEDPETCKLVVAMDAVCDKYPAVDGMHPTLIFQREDVEIEDVEINENPSD